MEGGIPEPSYVGLFGRIMTRLPIHSHFIIQILLRLDDNRPTWWESRIMNIEVVGLEGEACEYR